MSRHFSNRRRRSIEPFRTYFLTCSFKGRMKAFQDEIACIAYLLVLRRMIFTMNVELHGYVLMPNHVHLLITPKGCNLSQFLFRLQGTSARYINRVLRWHGQLWDHYCYDRILQTENERAAALHYIHQNPVKGGLVTHAENYPWIGGEELFHGAPEGSPTIPV